MADLLFELVVPDRREREFRLRDMALENFTNEELRCRYRFGRDSLQFLTELLQDDLQRQTRRNHALTPTVQLLVALRFFASGSFLQIIGDTVGLSKSTVSKIITGVRSSCWQTTPVHRVAVSRRNPTSEGRLLSQGRVPRSYWVHRRNPC